MSELLRYVLVDGLGLEQDYEYESYDDAVNEASGLPGKWAVICRTYTYDDSELVWTCDGSQEWA